MTRKEAIYTSEEMGVIIQHLLEILKKLIEKHPNDADLGAVVRKLYNK